MKKLTTPACVRLVRTAVPAILMLALILVSYAPAADEPASPAGTIAVLKGHTDLVYAIAFSPDGKQLATGSFDKSVRLWDAATGKELKSFNGHQNYVLGVAFSPDGQTIASSAEDNTARLWTMPASGAVSDLAHADVVQAVALSADGKLLAAACKDGSVRLWNPAEKKLVHSLTGHKGAVLSVAFSPNGKLVAGSGADGTLRVWNPADGKLEGTIIAHPGSANAVGFHPVLKAAVTTGDDGTVKVWAVPSVSPRELFAHADGVNALALSTDGATLISGSQDKTVRISDTTNGKEVRQLKEPTAAVTCVAIAPDGKTIAAGTADKKVYRWNAADGKLIEDWKAHDTQVAGVALHPDNKRIVTAGKDGAIKLWTPDEDEPDLVIEAHPGGVSSVQLDQKGGNVLAGGADKTVKLWDLKTGKSTRTFGTLADPVAAVAFNTDYTQAAAAAGKIAKIWNAADGKELKTLTHPSDVLSLSFSPEKGKNRLVTGAADGRSRLWDLDTGKELEAFSQAGPVKAVIHHKDKTIISGSADKTVTAHVSSILQMIPFSEKPVRGVAVMPDGKKVIAAGDDKSVKLWGLSAAKAERSYEGANGAVTALALSKNGALVAAGGADQTVRVYNAADGKVLGTFQVKAGVRGLAFNTAGNVLAAACADNSVLAWSTPFTAGQPVPAGFGKALPSLTHRKPATSVAFAPDTGLLWSASDDQTVRGWKFSVEGAKSLAHPNFVDAAAFDASGEKLATACHDGQVRVWDVDKAKVAKAITAHTSPIYCLTWTADGKQVVSGSQDQSLKLWDAAEGKMVREFKAYKAGESEKGHRAGVFAAAFSPSGKHLASAGWDRGIKLWNVADGTVAREFVNPKLKDNEIKGNPPTAHPGFIYGLRFTPDGKRLISAGLGKEDRGYLAVWNVADGALLHAEELPIGYIYSLAVSPDGKQIAIACGRHKKDQHECRAYVMKMPVEK